MIHTERAKSPRDLATRREQFGGESPAAFSSACFYAFAHGTGILPVNDREQGTRPTRQVFSKEQSAIRTVYFEIRNPHSKIRTGSINQAVFSQEPLQHRFDAIPQGLVCVTEP